MISAYTLFPLSSPFFSYLSIQGSWSPYMSLVLLKASSCWRGVIPCYCCLLGGQTLGFFNSLSMHQTLHQSQWAACTDKNSSFVVTGHAPTHLNRVMLSNGDGRFVPCGRRRLDQALRNEGPRECISDERLAVELDYLVWGDLEKRFWKEFHISKRGFSFRLRSMPTKACWTVWLSARATLDYVTAKLWIGLEQDR